MTIKQIIAIRTQTCVEGYKLQKATYYSTSQRLVVSARIPSASPLGRTANTHGWD